MGNAILGMETARAYAARERLALSRRVVALRSSHSSLFDLSNVSNKHALLMFFALFARENNLSELWTFKSMRNPETGGLMSGPKQNFQN